MPSTPPRSPGRRTPIIIALAIVFTILGTATTYKVAWSLYIRAVASGNPTIPQKILSCPLGSWPEPAPLWPAPFIGRVTCNGFDSTAWVARAKPTPNGLISVVAYTEVSRVWQEIAIGFPFRCARQRIRFENWHVPVPVGHVPAPRLDDGTDFPSPGGGSGVTIPWRPIWLGLLADTAIFGVALFFLFTLARRVLNRLDLTGRIRRHKGLCPRCGYDRAGLTPGVVCPECGATP